jgi:predicted outer membrane protein
MATIYLAPSPEIAATRLPTRWSGTTLAVNQKALALLDKLKVKPEDNDTSESLAGAAAKKRQELSKLSGAAFDKAYAQNEVAYHQTVNGALETTLIPSAMNGERLCHIAE